MPDPFLLILGVIAIACVILFPIRLMRKRTRRYGTDEDGGAEVPLASPERQDRG
jgi:hypothetical protein